jgi:hypothetical protein
MERPVNAPRFSAKARLVRYVDEINRLSGNRASPAAFIDPPTGEPGDHLSVNSLELESVQQIARYHRWRGQGGRGRVALIEHKVHEYSDAAIKAGVPIYYDRHASCWQFSMPDGAPEAAYRHRPVKAHNSETGGSDQMESPSHCGAEFKRALSLHAAARFARRMSGKRFHLA